jgi:hypothetical protein
MSALKSFEPTLAKEFSGQILIEAKELETLVVSNNFEFESLRIQLKRTLLSLRRCKSLINAKLAPNDKTKTFFI